MSGIKVVVLKIHEHFYFTYPASIKFKTHIAAVHKIYESKKRYSPYLSVPYSFP
jgi:hypothetical protein